MVLFGSEYWDEVIDFEAMARWGTISPEDLSLFHRTDSVDDAFEHITTGLAHHMQEPNAKGANNDDRNSERGVPPDSIAAPDPRRNAQPR